MSAGTILGIIVPAFVVSGGGMDDDGSRRRRRRFLLRPGWGLTPPAAPPCLAVVLTGSRINLMRLAG